jgi:glutamyl-tRNA reductase
MGEMSAEYLVKYGVNDVRVVNRTVERAHELAERLGGIAAAYEERWQHFIEADIIISSTACPHIIFTREEGEYVKAGAPGASTADDRHRRSTGYRSQRAGDPRHLPL